MGGHAKRHTGNVLLNKKDYRIEIIHKKEIAEDELGKLLENTTITWISDDGKEERRIM